MDKKLLIAIIVILLIVVVGLMTWVIILTKNGNSLGKNDASNGGSTVNIADMRNNTTVNNNRQANTNTTDPYANYPNFAWVRTTLANYPETNSDSVWIDKLGIINISFPTEFSLPNVTINSISEKPKYYTFIPDSQSVGDGEMLVLTENNNLYVIIFSSGSNPIIQKISSNVIEIYDDYTDINELNIPNTDWPMSRGTFTEIYALTGDGKLLSINASYDSSTDKTDYVLGLSYEDCTSIKKVLWIGKNDYFIQITKDDYLRDASNVQMNYILDSNNNKISIKYSFDTTGSDMELLGTCDYIITQDNKIYKVDYYNGINDYRIDLLNNKTVNGINYDSNNSVITVTYTDNTTDTFNCDQYFNPDINKYGF
ncbi:MAG: hypothetical protein FWF46_08790 [Oscillospiraceae bacterium]|nr:hypothetical protein [Oscillospiraceae bacterium]